MIDTLLNLLFRCSHQRMTRPLAPITKAGQPHSQTYVVCLDCPAHAKLREKLKRIERQQYSLLENARPP